MFILEIAENFETSMLKRLERKKEYVDMLEKSKSNYTILENTIEDISDENLREKLNALLKAYIDSEDDRAAMTTEHSFKSGVLLGYSLFHMEETLKKGGI
ncbi:hypothetical protein [Clostridiisalibacter paucivorans]|uniref:hypothetical protein n=1 Tax=Clostridiisalibacter paucivorans TaxID=408753 RepID=UPI00047E3196|nr:hypothetical protein [Clostridiisalibacter paucivorans]